MDHNVVRNWLHTVLAPYPLADRVYAHLDALLLAFHSLSPRTEVYSTSPSLSTLTPLTLVLRNSLR